MSFFSPQFKTNPPLHLTSETLFLKPQMAHLAMISRSLFSFCLNLQKSNTAPRPLFEMHQIAQRGEE